jgi:archaellum component FlaC
LILKDVCGKFSIIEQKWDKLDSIEDRLNKFDPKFGTVVSEIKFCKERIHVLDDSAQFLSDIKDEHNSIKIKLEAISQSVAASKNVTNYVKDRLVDFEKQNLSNSLLFFAI